MCRLDDWHEAPDFYVESCPTARKTHTCGECRRAIAPSEKYFRAFGKWEGHVGSHIMCAHCEVAADWLLDQCGGYMFGEIQEDFAEHSEGSMEMLRIVVGMRRKWKSFTDPLQLMPIPATPSLTP